MSNIRRFLSVFLLAFLVEAGTVKDLLGRRVKVPDRPRRIICIGPGALRLIVYLKAHSRVVGIEEIEKKYPEGRPYILANPWLSELEVFGKGGPPGENPLNYEKIAVLRPQVIFATYMDREEADRLSSRLKVPVVVLSYGELATFENEALFRSLRLAGEILGKESRAENLISYINRVEKDLRRRTSSIPSSQKPRVYVGGLGHKGSHGIDSTMARFPVFKVLGLRSPVDSLKLKGWISVSREMILEWDPDFIFIDEGGLGIVLQDVRRNPGFYKALRAVREGRVYGLLPFNYYTTNIEVALSSAYYVGKVLFPDKFADINPEIKADEIFKFFVGKPVYQEMKKDYGGYRKIRLFQ